MKKAYKKTYDIGTREAPVLFVFGKLYIGNEIDTHTTLLNKILGLELQFKTEDEALDINWNSKGITRFDDLDDSKILFGHLVSKTIYWEDFQNKKLIEYAMSKNREYKHRLNNIDRVRVYGKENN